MTRLIITIGLPGSGKTRRARAWVAEQPETRARVNRDDIRAMLGCLPVGTPAQDNMIAVLQYGAVRALLDAGHDVVCDDTNLISHEQKMAEWARLALTTGAELVIWDLRDVPLTTCIERDLSRAAEGGRYVGADIIAAMWTKHTTTGTPS